MLLVLEFPMLIYKIDHQYNINLLTPWRFRTLYFYSNYCFPLSLSISLKSLFLPHFPSLFQFLFSFNLFLQLCRSLPLLCRETPQPLVFSLLSSPSPTSLFMRVKTFRTGFSSILKAKIFPLSQKNSKSFLLALIPALPDEITMGTLRH